MRTTLRRPLAAALLLACIALPASAMDLKLAIATPHGHHATMGLEKMLELIKKYTDGKITGEVFVGGQLISGERELMDGLQFGTVDIGLVSTGMMTAYDERFAVFSLPFLFRDVDNAYKTCDGPVGEAFAKIVADKAGVRVIGWTMGGIHIMTNNKRPVNSMADVKGLKIRCMENPVITEAWKAYGAVATPMSLGEVFTALQQGALDGQDNGAANTYANKYYEVQKYLVMTQHMIVPGFFVMSQAVYDAIPDDLKPAFDRAVAEATLFQREENARQEAAAVENMKARGMEVCYPDKTDFVKAAQSVKDKFIGKMGKEMEGWINDIQNKY